MTRLTAIAARLNPWKSARGADPGRPRTVAAEEHGIRRSQIHPHALHIVEQLERHGHQALLVGGAVRDLLLGRTPKDFDVATSATPEQVRRLFRNARIIGRRFRLCLLRFGDVKVEVSTFRGPVPHTRAGMIHRDNSFGTPREDAFRRDFTINALMLDPIRMTLIDQVGGLEDLQARRIRTITPPQVSFTEDPVRMMRCVRFQARLGFTLDPAALALIPALAEGLQRVTRHRLADEMQRFLCAGNARVTFAEFDRLGLLAPLLGLEPHAWFFDPPALTEPLPALAPYLEALDGWTGGQQEPLPPTVTLLGLLATLAVPEFRRHLAGTLGESPRDKALLRSLARRLPRMLGEWGLLRGQVEPAIQILEAARWLLAQQDNPRAGHRSPRLGEREAWLLIGVLRGQLGVDAGWTEAGLARVPDLPDLPIMDHPRPLGRPQGTLASGGDAEPHGQRKRRRGRKAGRHAAPADA